MNSPHHGCGLLSRRSVVASLGAAMSGLAGIAPRPAVAQAMAPAGPLSARILSPYPAGGSVDFWARAVQQGLEGLGKGSVPVNYMPGGSGVVAANHLMEASADQPPTLLLGGGVLLSQLPLQADSGLRRDPNDALMPLAILWEEPLFVVVRGDSALQTLDGLLASARAPSTTSAPRAPLSYGTAGAQSTGGVCFSHVARRHAMPATQVPYRGMPEVVTQLLGGHVDIGLLSYQQTRPHLESRALRVLGSTGDTRSPLLPAVPTLVEAGLAEFGCSAWFGLFVRRDTPAAQHDALRADLATVLGAPSLRRTMTDNGYGVLGLLGTDADQYLRRSNAAWRVLLGR